MANASGAKSLTGDSSTGPRVVAQEHLSRALVVPQGKPDPIHRRSGLRTVRQTLPASTVADDPRSVLCSSGLPTRRALDHTTSPFALLREEPESGGGSARGRSGGVCIRCAAPGCGWRPFACAIGGSWCCRCGVISVRAFSPGEARNRQNPFHEGSGVGQNSSHLPQPKSVFVFTLTSGHGRI